MAGLYKGPRRELVIRDSDLIWMARMLVGEGGEKISLESASAALWAMANRYLLHPNQEAWSSFTGLLRAFSQPINPRWARGGEFCRPGGRWEGNQACLPSALDRRERITRLTWANMPKQVKEAVIAFQGGALFPPDKLTSISKARISNWAAVWLKKSRNGRWVEMPEAYPWGIEFEKNWFFEDQNLIPGHVEVDTDPSVPVIRFESGFSTLSILGGAAIVGGGFLVAKLLLDHFMR